MKVKFFAELKHGYKKTMDIEETKELSLIIEAKNIATASRMFKALVNMDNIEEYSYICIEE